MNPEVLNKLSELAAKLGTTAGYLWQVMVGRHEEYVFLRYSKGPGLGVFWDCYGDDFQYVGLAIRAILAASCPQIHYVPDSRIGL